MYIIDFQELLIDKLIVNFDQYIFNIIIYYMENN